MENWQEIIAKHYTPGTPLYDTLTGHSRQVAELAVDLSRKYNVAHGAHDIDTAFVWQAAMLHDIGIIMTDAPSIHCYGKFPYICHGVIGAEMLRAAGMERHALVCERHTGAGLSIDDIKAQNLPLPSRQMLPITLEEQVICLADKFFSKSRLHAVPRTPDQVRQSLSRHGHATLQRLDELMTRFLPTLRPDEAAV